MCLIERGHPCCPPLHLSPSTHYKKGLTGPPCGKCDNCNTCGLRKQQHELLGKTQAALKSPAVVCNDENIPNLAWIYNYAESTFESLYWNFSIPIYSPRRKLVWIICRDCVCEGVWFFFSLFKKKKCRSQMFQKSQNHNKRTSLRSI